MMNSDEQTNTEKHKQRVQGLMMFLGALGDSLEFITDDLGAESVCFNAGKRVGLDWKVSKKTKDIFIALDAVREEMEKMGINWPFDKYKQQLEQDFITQHDDCREIKLPFKNCIVRCTLFRYGFPQGKSLCQTKHGLFCGLFENIYSAKNYLGISHAGENACLLNLKIYD
jgi:predicted hydrocarbon binding protein